MIRTREIAYGVRVRLNKNFEKKCLGDDYLMDEEVLFICEPKPYNDTKGEYVMLRGGSLTTGGYAYLDQLDLVNPIPNDPLYVLYPDDEKDMPIGMNPRSDKNILPPTYTYQEEPYFSGRGNHSVKELEDLLVQYKEYGHQQALIKQFLISKFDKVSTIIHNLSEK